MIAKIISFPDPVQNLAYDDVLFFEAEKNEISSVLRFWESKVFFVVLGRTCQIEKDVCIDSVKKDSIPVLRRSSGGGTVLQGPGCLNYTLIVSKDAFGGLHDLHKSYEKILEKIVSAFKRMNVDSLLKPPSDLVIKEGCKKFSGNAQRRGRRVIMHHGTMLYDFNFSRIEKYLKMPPKMPDYRNNRNHSDFLENLPLSAKDIVEVLCEAFDASKADNAMDHVEIVKEEALQRQVLQTIYTENI